MISNILKEFSKGIDLIEQISNEDYTKEINGASLGAHFRHCIDFAYNLLKGLESGEINYNNRERDIGIEVNKEHAKERLLFLSESLKTISVESFSDKVLSSSEIEDKLWLESTIARELEFLHSHTVHHYAIINEKLKSAGIKVKYGFGVAPSTLKYWAENKTQSKLA